MQQAYDHPSDVLRFAAKAKRANIALALVIVTHVTGGAMRGRGAMMCVTQEAVAGYVSNGCVDADIIFQARDMLKTGGVKRVRYGNGSPFKDIELPCGGRIDLLITANMDQINLYEISAALEARRSVDFHIEDFHYTYVPPVRLRIAGRGDAVHALARQAYSTGFSVILQSPDKGLRAGLSWVQFDHLTDPNMPPPANDDAWTAVVVMFHDHDWEPYILAQACVGKAFYIGAMGSVRTHNLRKKMLQEQGVSEADIARIRGPIGLIGSMRDANLLALSTLAEIVDTAQKADVL